MNRTHDGWPLKITVVLDEDIREYLAFGGRATANLADRSGGVRQMESFTQKLRDEWLNGEVIYALQET